MKKWIYSMLIALCGMIATMTFTACGGDDDDGGSNGSGLTGWYYTSSHTDGIYTGEEILSMCREDLLKDGTIKADDYFYPDGLFGKTPPAREYWDGTVWVVEEAVTPYLYKTLYVMHIIDNQTIECYETSDLWKLGASGAKGLDLLYQISCPYLGTLAFYGKPAYYYVYTRNGNTISFTDNGEKVVFAITSDGLLQSGGGKWTKYNPSTVY